MYCSVFVMAVDSHWQLLFLYIPSLTFRSTPMGLLPWRSQQENPSIWATCRLVLGWSLLCRATWTPATVKERCSSARTPVRLFYSRRPITSTELFLRMTWWTPSTLWWSHGWMWRPIRLRAEETDWSTREEWGSVYLWAVHTYRDFSMYFLLMYCWSFLLLVGLHYW